jgi:hypothetical protein
MVVKPFYTHLWITKSQLTDIYNKAVGAKTGNFTPKPVKIGDKVFKEIPEATKKEMVDIIAYLKGTEVNKVMESTLEKLAVKYNISMDLSKAKQINLFNKLVENTKTK